jgi:hypothetical protein
MTDYKLLRLSAALVFMSSLVSIVGTILHPSREDPNNYTAVFSEYAHSSNWTAVHLIQFVGLASLIAGLLVLFFALNLTEGTLRWVGIFGSLSAVVTLAVSGVQYAVDGVALKQAVDAWASASAAEQVARLASAEAIRWLEWGAAGYADMLMGLTLVLLGIAIVGSARISWLVGVLMGLSGLGFIAKGWVLSTVGFAPIGAAPSTAAQILMGAVTLGLLMVAWRKNAKIMKNPQLIGKEV